MIIIYPHLHSRRTGVTSSLESIIPIISQQHQVLVFGESIKNINSNFVEALKIIVRQHRNESIIWHANRNIEILIGLSLRIIFPLIKVVSIRHSDGIPSWPTRFLLKKSNKIITLTKKVQNTLQSLQLESECIHHGIDLKRFDSECYFEPVLDKNNNKKYIGIIGRVRPDKGQLELIKSSIKLLQINPDWHVVVLGKTQKKYQFYKKLILEEIKNCNLEHQITLIEEVKDPRPIYRDLDLVVVASRTEGFSMVPLESMAMKVPVIATRNVGVHDELIKNGYNGWLYDSGNTNELQEIIITSCKKTDVRDAIANQAYVLLKQSWTVEKEADKYIGLYNRLFN